MTNYNHNILEPFNKEGDTNTRGQRPDVEKRNSKKIKFQKSNSRIKAVISRGLHVVNTLERRRRTNKCPKLYISKFWRLEVPQ